MTNEFYKNSGMRIRKSREKEGCTRENLAEMSEISYKFLYEIETGRKGFSAETLSKIAKSLGVSSDYVIYGE